MFRMFILWNKFIIKPTNENTCWVHASARSGFMRSISRFFACFIFREATFQFHLTHKFHCLAPNHRQTHFLRFSFMIATDKKRSFVDCLATSIFHALIYSGWCSLCIHFNVSFGVVKPHKKKKKKSNNCSERFYALTTPFLFSCHLLNHTTLFAIEWIDDCLCRKRGKSFSNWHISLLSKQC